jgi:arylsulfatase A-like enzyme
VGGPTGRSTATVRDVARRPRNVIVVLLDSLNRHMLGCYGGEEFHTPNIDRLAASSLRFTSHHVGSLPCMPARHDILCGALDFLWKPWGSIEVWEEAVTVPLRRAGVVTKLVTDHPHLFEAGGENYHVDFAAWAYERGHEGDAWRTRPDPSWVGAPSYGRGHTPYDTSRGWFTGENDFPGPRTMEAAARWLDEEAPADERFLLFVDEFDPHEPFDTPEPYASMYDPDWRGAHLIWPPYATRVRKTGVLTDEEARQVRAQYGGKLTMIDSWLGRLLDAVDRNGFAGDTAVILCTDHGHYLGEHDLFGKPGAPVYSTLGHVPLLVRWPGVEPGTREALTTSVDLHATLCDVFEVSSEHRTHGRSLVPLVDDPAASVREWALFGVWGREVHVTDGRSKYARGPEGDNAPLSMWSNRWSTMPVHHFPDLRLPPPDERARLDRMPGSSIPVIRQPFVPGDMLPYWAFTRFEGNLLFDLDSDPDETENRAGEPAEKVAVELLHAALVEVEAPDDQFVRLGFG